MDNGRIEDGEVTECMVCGQTMHLYAEDNSICPGCAHGGWGWTKAQYVRIGDVVSLGGKEVEVDGEERWGLRVMIYSGPLTLSRRVNSPVLVRQP